MPPKKFWYVGAMPAANGRVHPDVFQSAQHLAEGKPYGGYVAVFGPYSSKAEANVVAAASAAKSNPRRRNPETYGPYVPPVYVERKTKTELAMDKLYLRIYRDLIESGERVTNLNVEAWFKKRYVRGSKKLKDGSYAHGWYKGVEIPYYREAVHFPEEFPEQVARGLSEDIYERSEVYGLPKNSQMPFRNPARRSR